MATNVQSKFWGDDSESSYSDSSEYSSDGGERDNFKRMGGGATNWVANDSSSDDDDNRIVRSARAKARELIQNHLKTMEHHKAINDFSELLKDYDNVAKIIEKQYTGTRMPKLIVQMIVDLQEFIETKQKDKESLKKLSKARAISFNTLRSRLRKFNEQFAHVLEEYNKDPENYEDILKESSDDYEDSDFDASDDEEMSDSDESDEEYDEEEEDKDESDVEFDSRAESGSADGSLRERGDEMEDDSDQSDWSDSGMSSVSENDTTDKHKTALAKWGVKKTDTTIKETKQKTDAKKPRAKLVKKKDDKDRQVAGSGMTVMAAVSMVAEKVIPALEQAKLDADDNPFGVSTPEIEAALNDVSASADSIRSYVKSIVERRGKRGSNTSETIRHLKTLPYIAKRISQSLYIYVVETLLHIQFDSYSNAYGSMNPRQWIETYRIVSHLLGELVKHPSALLSSETMESDNPNEDDKEGVTPDMPAITKEERIERSMTILESIVRRLNDELYKGLLLIEIHHDDYKTMLVYIVNMLYLLHRSMIYYINRGKGCQKHAASVAMMILEHVHFREDLVAARIWELVRIKIADVAETGLFFPSDTKKPSDVVEELVYYVFKYGTNRERIRACLHLAFSKSLHGHYYEAKDLLLTPNMQELATETSISTQILLNRNLAQLGICAFSKGLINEAHSYLMDLCSQNRHKELLAQGLSMNKNYEKPPEQERAEKRRLLPFHMHLNIELIECVNNICALLLESANIAKSSLNSREIISRQFRRMFEMHEKQVFIGPPENNRDVIISTFKHMQTGNWRLCYKQLAGLNIWNRLTNKEDVLCILKERIKIEAFNTYVFKYVGVYDSFSVDQLSEMFDLEQEMVHSLLSKMIIAGDIHATWDDSSKCCLINHTEPTELQKLAIKLAENLATAVEQNEMMLNMKNPKLAQSQDRRFQVRDTKYSYGNRRDDRQHAAPTFNRNRRNLQGSRPNRQSQIGVKS